MKPFLKYALIFAAVVLWMVVSQAINKPRHSASDGCATGTCDVAPTRPPVK